MIGGSSLMARIVPTTIDGRTEYVVHLNGVPLVSFDYLSPAELYCLIDLGLDDFEVDA